MQQSWGSTTSSAAAPPPPSSQLVQGGAPRPMSSRPAAARKRNNANSSTEKAFVGCVLLFLDFFELLFFSRKCLKTCSIKSDVLRFEF